MDFFALPHLRNTREITEDKVFVLAWLSSTAAATILVAGPPEIGGMGDLDARAQAEAQRTGRPVDEISEEMFNTTTGELMKVPGIPVMYDYETFPQMLSRRSRSGVNARWKKRARNRQCASLRVRRPKRHAWRRACCGVSSRRWCHLPMAKKAHPNKRWQSM